MNWLSWVAGILSVALVVLWLAFVLAKLAGYGWELGRWRFRQDHPDSESKRTNPETQKED